MNADCFHQMEFVLCFVCVCVQENNMINLELVLGLSNEKIRLAVEFTLN